MGKIYESKVAPERVKFDADFMECTFDSQDAIAASIQSAYEDERRRVEMKHSYRIHLSSGQTMIVDEATHREVAEEIKKRGAR